MREVVLLITVLPFGLCACDFSTITPGDTCTDTWSNLVKILHPSQQMIGYAWVQRKLKDFTSAKDAQATMDSGGSTPVVIGPNKIPYIIDDHHTLSALEYSGFSDTTVTMEVVCDWSLFNGTIAEFYAQMESVNFWLGIGRKNVSASNDPYEPIDPSAIATRIGLLPDDPWRSLAGYARKIKDASCPSDSKYCKRAYDRECDPVTHTATSFFEFRWSYFMNVAYLNPTLWDNLIDAQKFKDLFEELSTPSMSPMDADPTQWQAVADALLPLCRGSKAGQYRLPDSLGKPFADTMLPGYVYGIDTEIDHDDPDCATASCPYKNLMRAKTSLMVV